MKCVSVFIIAPQDKEIVLSDFDFKDVVEIQRLFQSEEDFLFEVRKMIRCQIIVTYDGWENCSKCKKAVEVARVLDLEIVYFINYKNYVEQKYN